MAEWSNAPDSKSGIRLYRIEGSNPSPSAKTPFKSSTYRTPQATYNSSYNSFADFDMLKISHFFDISEKRVKNFQFFRHIKKEPLVSKGLTDYLP